MSLRLGFGLELVLGFS